MYNICILMDFYGTILVIDLLMFSLMFLTVFSLISSFFKHGHNFEVFHIFTPFSLLHKKYEIYWYKCFQMFIKHIHRNEYLSIRIIFQHGIEFYQEVGGPGVFSIQCSSFNTNACRIVSSHWYMGKKNS